MKIEALDLPPSAFAEQIQPVEILGDRISLRVSTNDEDKYVIEIIDMDEALRYSKDKDIDKSKRLFKSSQGLWIGSEICPQLTDSTFFVCGVDTAKDDTKIVVSTEWIMHVVMAVTEFNLLPKK